MADRTSDLEIFRDAFMHELTQAQPDVSQYQDFLRYWKSVESEAMQTEDLGKLDEWVRELSRDKERVKALSTRTDTMGDKQDGALAQLAQILKLVLDILTAIERRLRRLRDERLSALASMLWKGGPGTIAKPKKDDEKKEKKDGGGGAAAAEAAQQPQDKLKQPEVKREKDKKMER